MKFVDQIVLKENRGDCFRACVASIFEFDINFMPNFWEYTSDAYKFWRLVNDWMFKNLNYKCIPIRLEESCDDFINDLLCVAIGKSKIYNEQHAVVWKNKLIFDPNPNRNIMKSTFIPEVYVIFIPINIK